VSVQHIDIDQDDGQRIDNFLLRTLRGVPRSRVYRMLRKGEVRVNGGRVAPEYRLRHGDRVRIPPWRPPETPNQPPAPGWQLEQLRSATLFEDDELIVLDKPSGIAVHGGSGVSRGVVELMRDMRPELARLELVHRLDRDTSGCLVLAKSRSALLRLHGAFREGEVRKTYDVLVHGAWPRRVRSVSLRLTRYVAPSGERRVRSELAGKAARTEFAIERTAAQVSWLRAHPHTGRTHQIRVHCQMSGHPVIGDEKYASDEQQALARAAGVRRLCLHARSIVFPGEPVRRFEAPIPGDMLRAWEALLAEH
jgi:23S rRNA pseudouridine955/2504/2580 synthase